MLTRFLKRPPTGLFFGAVSAPSGPLQLTGTPRLHPMALVDPKAKVADDCEIGPFCTVGPEVTLGPGCKLLSHVVITGNTTIGAENVFHPNCVIGSLPQDKKYRGELARLIVGSRNTFREAVTIHVGTAGGGGVTRVGDNNLLMVNAHVGHDCQVGNNCILANNVMLAGHVVLGNHVVMSGAAASHHYVTFGDHVFVAGMSRINKDVPPFVKVSDGDKMRTLNAEGMRRAGFGSDEIELVRDAARRLLFNRDKPLVKALAEFESVEELPPLVRQLVEAVRRRSSGKHGRHMESLRSKKGAAAGGEAQEAVAKSE